jgi:hypothetical protein
MNLEGEIGEINLIERLVELGREQFTGAIRFENDGIIKIIYFKTGDVLSASTNDRSDSIDEILMRAGKVSRDHVKQALAKRKETETLGDALLSLGFITRKELTWARRVQVIGVIRSIAAWTAGSFTVVADYLPKREEGTLFPLPQIITELIVTDPDRAKFDGLMEGGNAVFDRAADFDESFRRLGLNEDAAAIAMHVDGVNTASEVAMLSGQETFTVYKLLHALSVLGLLTRAAATKAQAEDEVWSFADAGVADAADMWTTSSEPETESVPTTMEIPALSLHRETEPESVFETEPEPIATFEPEPEPAPAEMAPPPSASMPSWERTTPPPPITPAPVFDEPAAEEPQWGFDEAQIEAARRASVPVRADEDEPPPMIEEVEKASKPGRAGALLIAAVLIVLVGFGAYGGWVWWHGRQATQQAQWTAAATPRPHRRPVIRPKAPATTASVAPAPMVVTTTTATTATERQARTPVAPPRPVEAQASSPVPTSTVARLDRTATGAAIITNTPTTASEPSSDAQRSKYDAMAKQFATTPGGEYTVQFELVCETASVTRALREGGNQVWFIPIAYRGRSCYRVFWGRYANRADAQAAVASIPAALREAAPVVVHVPKS